MVMLAMMALDEKRMVCMCPFDLFCCYSSAGMDVLEWQTLAFVGDTMNGTIPVLLSLTSGA
eukprot:9001045-Ditylum_brightwellii.AAC.1